jgi:hypothetical protein
MPKLFDALNVAAISPRLCSSSLPVGGACSCIPFCDSVLDGLGQSIAPFKHDETFKTQYSDTTGRSFAEINVLLTKHEGENPAILVRHRKPLPVIILPSKSETICPEIVFLEAFHTATRSTSLTRLRIIRSNEGMQRFNGGATCLSNHGERSASMTKNGHV